MTGQGKDPNQSQAQGPGGQHPPSYGDGLPRQVILAAAVPAVVPTRERLAGRVALPDRSKVPLGPLTSVFPRCTNELLTLATSKKSPADDEVRDFFAQYFKVSEPDPTLVTTRGDSLENYLADGLRCKSTHGEWPGGCCICSPCIRLDGQRPSNLPEPPPSGLRRLFAGDALWLFYMERMGIFQILGAILDAYAYSGKLPISNGSLDPGLQDDIVALVLEVMVRLTKTGESSCVRDRAAMYRTTLGWVSEPGRKLGLDTIVNNGFNTLFHKFIYHALEFYKDKRLAFAIRGVAADQPPVSAATLITLRDTIDLLKKRFEPFSYGRAYNNTLSGIVWAIAGMSVIRELKNTIGIPSALSAPDEYIPAAYDILVLKRQPTQGDTNRYLVHRECAQNGRDLLLEMEVLDHKDATSGGELDRWLQQIESNVEGYRTAYRTLTGVDIGTSATPVIEQQA